MSAKIWGAIAIALTTAPALAAPTKPLAPLAPLVMLPSVPRVKIGVTPSQVVVTEEVNLPRGEWKGEPLDFYVAFGAPGAPRAIDAHLVAVGDGSLEPADDEAGEPCPTERAPRRPPTAHPLLGRETMAGIVVHLKKESLERALAAGNMAALRIRTVLDLPEEDASGGRSVLVRLGASRGTPLTLGRIVVTASGLTLAKADARLCGPDADAHPLALSGVPRASESPTGASERSERESVIAPVLAVRHATDDLCVRFFEAKP